MRNLRLKKEALDALKLPVDILEGTSSSFHLLSSVIDPTLGHVGEMSFRIPWSEFGSLPVYATLKDLYILVGPSTHNDSTVEEDIQRALEQKLKKLANAEALRVSAGVNLGII